MLQCRIATCMHFMKLVFLPMATNRVSLHFVALIIFVSRSQIISADCPLRTDRQADRQSFGIMTYVHSSIIIVHMYTLSLPDSDSICVNYNCITKYDWHPSYNC